MRYHSSQRLSLEKDYTKIAEWASPWKGIPLKDCGREPEKARVKKNTLCFSFFMNALNNVDKKAILEKY